MNRKKTVSHVFTYIVLILVCVEVLALVCWLIFPVAPNLSQEGACRHLVELETKTFILTGSLAPILTVLVLFSWITKPASHLNKRINQIISSLVQNKKNGKKCQLTKRNTVFIVGFAVFLSVLVAFYPFASGLNVNMAPVGVDVNQYQEWLTEVANQNILEATSTFFVEQSDRPLSLLFLYTIKTVTGLPASTVVQYCPLILVPALVLGVYFFVHKTKTSNTSLTAALLAVSSFHIVIGIYGFYLSNMMAIIELYFFMAFCFDGLNKKSTLQKGVALLLSVMLLFTHSGTWGMIIGVLLVYLALTVIHKREKLDTTKKEVLFIAALVLVNISVAITRNLILGIPITSFETINIAQKTTAITGLETFSIDIFYTFFNTHYGFFVNPTSLALAIIGGIATVKEANKAENRFFTALLIGSSIFFVFSSGWIIKSRILLILPFPVFAAVGLVTLTNIFDRVFDQTRTFQIKKLTIIGVVLVGLNYAFRAAFEMAQIA
jgi:hypothetical protein